MTRWLLNSAVLPHGGYGRYDYQPATREEAIAFLREPGWESRVGWPETKRYLERLAPGVDVRLSRKPSPMAPGDLALVCRLAYREATDTRGALHALRSEENFELAFLRRLP